MKKSPFKRKLQPLSLTPSHYLHPLVYNSVPALLGQTLETSCKGSLYAKYLTECKRGEKEQINDERLDETWTALERETGKQREVACTHRPSIPCSSPALCYRCGGDGWLPRRCKTDWLRS